MADERLIQAAEEADKEQKDRIPVTPGSEEARSQLQSQLGISGTITPSGIR